MYEGYRLKINGVVFPDTNMAKDTWRCIPNKRRLVNCYYTADGKRHEIFSPATKADIRFSIREHTMDDHAEIAAFFAEKENVQVTFWNDTDCVYETRTCKISDITWASASTGRSLLYRVASVVITED